MRQTSSKRFMRAKWSGAKHNFTVLDVCCAMQALCQSVCNHKVSAKSDESKNTLKDQSWRTPWPWKTSSRTSFVLAWNLAWLLSTTNQRFHATTKLLDHIGYQPHLLLLRWIKIQNLDWRDFHEMAPPFNMRTYRVCDRRVSVSPAQSESTAPYKTFRRVLGMSQLYWIYLV